MKYLLFILCLILVIAAIFGPGLAAGPGVPDPGSNRVNGSGTTGGGQSATQSGEVVFPVVRGNFRRVPGPEQSPIPVRTSRTPEVTASPFPTSTRTFPPTTQLTVEHTPRPTTPPTTQPTTPVTNQPTTQLTTETTTQPTIQATTQPTVGQTTQPTAGQTTQVTTQPTTQPTTAPVVTVTVFVYQSGPAYSPVYYYPPEYSYPITSYYPSGSLTVTSDPTNAIVMIDGYTTQTTPYVFTNLMTGYHTVEVDYPGYEAYVTSVYIDNGGSYEVDANLVNLVSYGSLYVDSTPRGADVYVDGNYEGTSVTTVSGLSAGPHQLELHLGGYEVLSQTVDVVSGQGTNVNPVLVPLTSSSGTGSIDISSDQPGSACLS